MKIAFLFILLLSAGPLKATCPKGVEALAAVATRTTSATKAVKLEASAMARQARFTKDEVIENVLSSKLSRGTKLEAAVKKELGVDIKLTLRQKFALSRIKSKGTKTEVDRAKSWKSKPSMIESLGAENYKLQVEAMRKAGIVDPDVQVVALKSGLLGFPPRKGILDNFETLFGKPAAHERELLAQTTLASDLFATRFAGSVDEMVKTNSFRDGNLYQGNLELWWERAKIDGAKSKSPITKEYGEGASREVWWPKRQVEASNSPTGSSTRNAAMDDMRVAINSSKTKLPDGRVVLEERSIEVIAKNSKTGEFEPFFYEKVDGKWVSRETFKLGSREVKVKEACIKCHKGTNGKFSPLPQKPLVKDVADLVDRGYTKREAEDFFRAFGKNH